jgi:hypothetical protein
MVAHAMSNKFYLIFEMNKLLIFFGMSHEGDYTTITWIPSVVKQGVCYTMPLPFTLKSILRQKMNYGNSNISPSKNIILKKTLHKKPKSFKIS